MGKGGGREGLRICLWMSWVVQWLISSIYVALAIIVFTKLIEAAPLAAGQNINHLYKNKIWRAPMASCILSALLVIGFDLLSCVILIKKSINRAGPGFGYGFLVAYCFTLSCFLLLCGLVMDGFKSTVKTQLEPLDDKYWSKYTTQTFIGAEVFALLTFCIFFLFGIMLLVLQGGVSEQLGIKNAKSARYAQLDPATIAAVAAVANGGVDAAPTVAVASSDPPQYGSLGYDQPQFGTEAQGYSYQGTSDYTQVSGAATYIPTNEYQTDAYGQASTTLSVPSGTGTAMPVGGFGAYGYGTLGQTYTPAAAVEDDTAGLLGGARVGTGQPYTSSGYVSSQI